MNSRIPRSAKAAGYWSALLAALFGIAYDVAQLAEWAGWLGSKGGPESSSTAFGLYVLLTPSLLLGPSFLMVALSIHQVASAEEKIWTHAAAAFATAYMVLTGTVYFAQLTWIAPRLAAGRTAGMEQFLFIPFDSFLYAVDILGYSLMSVATLFAGLALSGWARRLLIANGLLVPFIALQMYWHWLIWIAALWAVTFPAAMIAVAMLFRRIPASEGEAA